jgi:hypothetical protein
MGMWYWRWIEKKEAQQNRHKTSVKEDTWKIKSQREGRMRAYIVLGRGGMSDQAEI